jgi:hypothetical protein
MLRQIFEPHYNMRASSELVFVFSSLLLLSLVAAAAADAEGDFLS